MQTHLYIEGHRAFRVRIRERTGRAGCRAVIAFLDPAARRQPLFVAGNWSPEGLPAADRIVHPSELHPAEPLTPAELREYGRLDTRLAGQDRPPRADSDRFEALRLRGLLHPQAPEVAAHA